MQTKLIFLDIDGTLIAPGEMAAPDSAVEAIHAAQANGHKVFLCTGRNVLMSSPLMRYGFDGYICSAGGHVVCGDEVLFDCPMDPDLRERARAALRENSIDCILEARDKTFGDEAMIQRFASFAKKKKIPQSMLARSSEAARWMKATQDGMLVRPVAEYEGQPIYKICYMAPGEEALERVRAQLEDDFFFCRQNMPGVAGKINGEMINRRFTKGTGIRLIAAHLGIPMSDTIGFGDSMNDLGMMEVVGLSVCMANGTEELKRLCDVVCPAVQEDGLARAFKDMGLSDPQI